MKKFLFPAAMIVAVIFSVSCKKESAGQVLFNDPASKKTDTCTQVTPMVQLGKDPSTGNISFAVIIAYNNPCSTYKALDVTVKRLIKKGKPVVFIHNVMLARPGNNELDADGYFLPQDTRGLSIEVKSYSTSLVQGKPCDVSTGSCEMK